MDTGAVKMDFPKDIRLGAGAGITMLLWYMEKYFSKFYFEFPYKAFNFSHFNIKFFLIRIVHFPIPPIKVGISLSNYNQNAKVFLPIIFSHTLLLKLM